MKKLIDGESSKKQIKWKKEKIDYKLGKVYAYSFEDDKELYSIDSNPVLMGYLKTYKNHLSRTIIPDII